MEGLVTRDSEGEGWGRAHAAQVKTSNGHKQRMTLTMEALITHEN